MRCFVTNILSKKATKHGIPDERFIEAARRAQDGRAYANHGGGLYKERIARRGQGRSGGFRTLFCLRDDGVAVFFVIFAKKQKANITNEELKAAQRIAATYREFSEKDIQAQVAAGRIREIQKGGDDGVTQDGET